MRLECRPMLIQGNEDKNLQAGGQRFARSRASECDPCGGLVSAPELSEIQSDGFQAWTSLTPTLIRVFKPGT